MNIPKSNFKFYYDDQWFVSVKLPIGSKPTVYMKCGKDNRPFSMIIQDIVVAIELLEEDTPRSFGREFDIAYRLPRLLGYKPSNAFLL